MVFAYCMLGGLILLFTPASLTSRLQLAYASVFRIPLETGRSLTIASRTASMGTNSASAVTIARLKNDVANLQAQLKQAGEIIDQLAGVRTDSAWDRIDLLPANVIKTDETDLTINCGQEQGVTVNQYVMALSDHSIIGRVSQVLSHTANVKLLTAPALRTEVQIRVSGVQGMMEGRGGGLAKIPYVSTQQTIAEDDPVYIRKGQMLDGLFIAGRVAKCARDVENPLLWDITVRSTCDVASLEQVAVIIPAR